MASLTANKCQVLSNLCLHEYVELHWEHPKHRDTFLSVPVTVPGTILASAISCSGATKGQIIPHRKHKASIMLQQGNTLCVLIHCDVCG